MGLPSGPGAQWLTKSFLDAEYWHEAPVEGQSAIEVSYAEENVGEHRGYRAHAGKFCSADIRASD